MKKSLLIKIGLIVSITIFAGFWGLNFLKSKGLFNNDKTFYAIYDRIDGLNVSNPVLINGYPVGQIRTISFLPDTSGRLIVEMAVNNEINVPGNSTARIFSSDLMGTKAIDLIFGDGHFLHQSGDTLIADFEGSIQELVSLQMLPLKVKAEDLMKQMEEAIEIVMYIFNKETQADITATFKNLKETFSNLENSSSNLDSIVNSSKVRLMSIIKNVESITSNLEKNNEAIAHALKNISNITDSLAQSNLKQTMSETYLLMANLNEITAKINNSEGTLGQLLNNDTLYFNIVDVTYNLNRLVEDLRMNPKRYVHLALFNTGKTVYVEEDQTDTKGKKEKAVYKIQIKQSDEPIILKPENFKGYKNVDEAIVNGIYIYIVGNEKNIESARLYLKEVKQDFQDAKIVEILDGEFTIVN